MIHTSNYWNDDLHCIENEWIENGFINQLYEEKLACDVDDLSSLLIEIEKENVENKWMEEEQMMDNWIGGLEQDVVNVDELSTVFDQLVNEQTSSINEQVERCEEKEEEKEEEDDDEITLQMVPCAPTWIMMTPLDPRSVIHTPVSKDVDLRIPRVKMPRMDVSLDSLVMPKMTISIVEKKKEESKKFEYQHDTNTCWICKSDKSTFKKFALHRYLAKRYKRNWKRGPRYTGRSHVATSRIRDGGRFIQTTQWI